MGCVERANCNGSHKFFWQEGLKRPITIILTNKEVPGFHINQSLKVLGISKEKYLEILKKL